jgi:hypothetical protein
MRIFDTGQFRPLGGIAALARFTERDRVFEAIRQAPIVQQSLALAG